MLAANDISLRRGPRTVLDGVSLAVEPGTFTALVGPKGAGKTSLLSLLAGCEQADEGRITLDGECLSLWDRAGLARRRAMLSQQVRLAFGFSALEVVLLGRCPQHGRERKDDVRIALEVLRAVNADRLRDRPYLELSGGEQQRVQLARVLAQIWDGRHDRDRPPYLLLDEPESGLDTAHQHFVLALARDLAVQGVGVVAVLRDLNLAARYATRAAVLECGRLLAWGDVETVLDPALLSNIYGIAARRHDTGRRMPST